MKMKRNTKIIALVMAIALALTMAPADSADAAKKVNVKKVTVKNSITKDSKNVVIAKGKSIKLLSEVKVTPSKAANKKVKFKSSNTKVATVNKKGVVKGVSDGKAKITVASEKNSKKKATINVKVVKNAVKRVSFAVKEITLDEGKSTTVAAKVEGKAGVSKILAWKSSNEKVALVNSKGKVTAVAGGTATITATAADGSRKKATYKVKVTDKVNFVSAKVVNPTTITFALDKPMVLTADLLSILRKVNCNGQYMNTLVITDVTTTDNINYTIHVDNLSAVNEGDYVRIECPSLTGDKKYIEVSYAESTTAYTGEVISKWMQNEYGTDTFSFDEEVGYSKLSISNLPAGLVAVVKDGTLIVQGKPSATGVVTSTITGCDELGNSITKTVKFIVGSRTVMVGASETVNLLFDSQSVGEIHGVTVVGGSGSYQLKVIEDKNNIVSNKAASGNLTNNYLDDYGNQMVNIRVYGAGDYTITVRAIDKVDSKKTCDIVIPVKVAQCASISGTIKDASGNGISAAAIYFANKDKNAKFGKIFYAQVDEKGQYKVNLAPGNYDVICGAGNLLEALVSNDAKYMFNQSFAEHNSTYDITLPVYKVFIPNGRDTVIGEAIEIDGVEWYSNNEYVGMGNTLYLKPGTYQLEGIEEIIRTIDVKDYYLQYKYNVTVTVTNSNVEAQFTRTEISRTAYE